MSAPKTCYYCGKEKELRPYGPGGAPVCFACAMDTPDRKAEAEQEFKSRLRDAASAGEMVMIGTDAGPLPVKIGGPHD